MESQPRASSIIATRLWEVVRTTFATIRKGLMSKRNSLGDMINGARSLGFNHYRHSRKRLPVGHNGYEYEFSCSNSPDQVFVPSAKNKTQFFPCMRLPKVIEDFVEDEPVYPEMLVFVAKTPEYAFNIQIERHSPLKSPSSEGISNHSSDDEGDGKYGQVDDKAEEFIARFHGQLRKQIVR
ncbi:hypothetical protein NL676_038207 [Syzygium grande]|nr:hypothetical protein NL676_038207 [Syzygium grande]